MKKPVNLVVSFILVLMIVVVVSKSMEKSYLKIKTNYMTTEKKSEKVTLNDKPVSSNNFEQKKASSNKVIVIDPGHANKANLDKEATAPNSSEMKIKDGGGAEGIDTKNPEYMINMKVALKLKSMLKEKGYTVKMTKEDNSCNIGNIERAEIGNKEKANIVVRIHADSSDNPSAKGTSILVPAALNENTRNIHEASKKYGEIVLKKLCNEVGVLSRGIIERKDMTGFNWSKVPVILVEMGFLSNREEDKLLSSDEYQEKIAKALRDGLIEALDK